MLVCWLRPSRPPSATRVSRVLGWRDASRPPGPACLASDVWVSLLTRPPPPVRHCSVLRAPGARFRVSPPPSPFTPPPLLLPDSLLGTHTAALYISLRYHAIHGAYIYDRVNALAAHRYRQTLLLVEVDVPSPAAALTELAGLSLRSGLTLLTASHPREAGRLLETLRVYEHKRPDGIEGPRPADGYAPALTAFLTAVRPVNKADVVALARGVGGVTACRWDTPVTAPGRTCARGGMVRAPPPSRCLAGRHGGCGDLPC